MRLISEWAPNTKEIYSTFIVPSILNGDLPSPLFERIAEVANEPQEAKLKALSVFQKTLRNLVEQWINSGRHDDGEEAWNRNVNWRPSINQWSIAETLMDYQRRHPPLAATGEDGRFEIRMRPSGLQSLSPISRARDMATYVFILLLDCPGRERLSQCEKCWKCFTRKRAPRKNMPIFHGTYCTGCHMQGGARRTTSTRTKRRLQMFAWAAVDWPKWTERKGDRGSWIAERVNERIKRHPVSWKTITGNWVTRHKEEIEAELKRRNDAEREN